MSDGMIGYNSTLSSRPLGDSGEHIEVAELIKISQPKITVADVEMTHMKSAGRRREYKPGLIAPGDMDFEINYTKAQQVLLRSYVGEEREWLQTYPDGSTDEYVGHINDMGGEIPVDNRITTTAKVKISGEVVFTAGVGS